MTRKLDLAGQKFGRLTVIDEEGRNKHGQIIWECLCDCGNTTHSVGTSLKGGYAKSCGCSRKGIVNEKNVKNLINQRFGRLYVIKERDERAESGNVVWKCVCDCGKQKLKL